MKEARLTNTLIFLSEPSSCTRLPVERTGISETKYGLKNCYYENDAYDLWSDRSDATKEK